MHPHEVSKIQPDVPEHKPRKQKRNSADSISSFDSTLQENYTDQKLMLTKKQRKDLEVFNDKVFGNCVVMERAMDKLIAKLVN